MQFSEYQTIRSRLKKVGWTDERIDGGQPFDGLGEQFTKSMLSLIHREDGWKASHRPYYRVYPSVEGLLLSVELDIPGDSLASLFGGFLKDVRGAAVAIEFSESSEIGGAAFVSLSTFTGDGGNEPAITITRQLEDGPYTTVVPITERTLEEEFWEAKICHNGPSIEKIVENHKAVRVFIGALMLANDPMLVEPIVLNRDAIKYKTASVEERLKIEDRAARNKGRGWAIGKGFEEQCEVSPHFRKSHLALFWTGKGRTVPRLQLRKGCLVKHRKLAEMPTGYHDDEQETPVFTTDT